MELLETMVLILFGQFHRRHANKTVFRKNSVINDKIGCNFILHTHLIYIKMVIFY